MLVEEVNKPEGREQLILYARTVAASTEDCDNMTAMVQDLLEPVRHFAFACLAVLSPIPFDSGSAPEHVWYAFGQLGNKKKACALSAIPQANAVAMELRSNQVWTQIYEEYCDFTGTEHSYVCEFVSYIDRIKQARTTSGR